MNQNVIFSINGPVVTVRDSKDFSMQEMVLVGKKRLVGEVISISDSITTIQVYESTTGLRPGEPVEPTGSPICATLAPGILSNILKGGQPFASCPETSLITHKALVHPEVSGTVTWCAPNGKYNIDAPLVKFTDGEGKEQTLSLTQKWPIRTPRPVAQRLPITRPLITGQRVIDTLFPIAKGGTAAVPGGFGTGKTMTQHQLAKWCDADIIVYIGCGERGNEMTQVLEEFSHLIDPKSGKALTDRTVLIANTSNKIGRAHV